LAQAIGLAAIIVSKPKASIIIYKSGRILRELRFVSTTPVMETIRSAWRKGPTSMDRFENGGTN
jgi:cyanophycinase-like exopeptidase